MLPELPAELAEIIGSVSWEQNKEGESDATVYKLSGDSIRYLKLCPLSEHSSVKEEYLRLQWLSGKIAVPQILHYSESDTHQFLLMSDCPGLHPLHDDLAWTETERIACLVSAAREFHAVPLDDCPYQMDFDAQIARAKYNIEHDLLRESLKEDLIRGRSTETIIAEFEALKPNDYDPVITHGDLYPVNMRVDADSHAITGYIDSGLMHVADRYTDLTAIANAIGWHMDKQWIARFFALYGVPVDEAKLTFYRAIHLFL